MRRLGLSALLTGVIFGSFGSGSVFAQGGSFGIEYGTGRIICTDDADISVNPDDPSYAASAAWDLQVLGIENPCGTELSDLDVGVWKQTRPFEGADSAGRTANFRIYVLHENYSWQSGSAERIEFEGADVSPRSIFEAPNFNERFCSGNAAFGLGAASSDGAQRANRAVATSRTHTIASALTEVRKSCSAGRIPIVFGVNLGEHTDRVPCADGTADCTPSLSDQRRVMIVATDEIPVDLNLPEALTAGLQEQDVFTSLDVGNYDSFKVESY